MPISNPAIIASMGNSNTNLGSKKHTRSQDAPVNPNIGDSWEQLDTNNNLIMFWAWNGSLWLSTDIQNFLSSNAIISTSTTNNSTLSFNQYDIFIKNLYIVSKITGVNNSSNYWRIRYNFRKKSDGTLIDLGFGIDSFNYSSNLTFPLTNIELIINTLVSKQVYYCGVMSLTKIGTPGNLETYTIGLTHCYART